jgi:segregation and condensation protein B
MDENAIKNILEAALLAANASVTVDKLTELFTARGADVDRAAVKSALRALADDYAEREIELKETASRYRIQVRSSSREWLQPLFEERAPRYTRALLETLALIAYRQPITRAEIEDVRGVAVSSNIVRTLIERGWIRVVGHREVPGKPSMLGTTKEFLDYFGLKKLDDLPPLAELREMGPDADPQSDFVDELAAVMEQAGEAPAEESEEPAEEPEESAEPNENGGAEREPPDDSEPAPNVIPIHQSEA